MHDVTDGRIVGNQVSTVLSLALHVCVTSFGGMHGKDLIPCKGHVEIE